MGSLPLSYITDRYKLHHRTKQPVFIIIERVRNKRISDKLWVYPFLKKKSSYSMFLDITNYLCLYLFDTSCV